MEGEAFSKLLARYPAIVISSKERVKESFKHAEYIGLKKGSKMFSTGVRAILTTRKEKLGQKQQFLSN